MKNLMKAVFLTAIISVTTSSTAVFADNGMRNGLPPTSLDSFVDEARRFNKNVADEIYGDEGTVKGSPYKGFTEAHRINRGIVGISNLGLTTGHGSYLPDATGGDEFIGKPECSQSGPNNGTYVEYQEPDTLPLEVIQVRHLQYFQYDTSAF